MTEQIKKERKRQPKKVKVRKIRQEEEAILVEWLDKDGYHRASVPGDAFKAKTPGLVEGTVNDDVLEVGIPHGLPWEDLVEIDVTPAMVANELRRVGIWTESELLMNPEKVRGAIGKIIGANYSQLLQNVKRYKEESNG